MLEIMKNLHINDANKEIANYTASKDTLETEADIANADDAIEYYQAQIDITENDPIGSCFLCCH